MLGSIAAQKRIFHITWLFALTFLYSITAARQRGNGCSGIELEADRLHGRKSVEMTIEYSYCRRKMTDKSRTRELQGITDIAATLMLIHCQRQKCSPRTLFSGDKNFSRYSEFPEQGASNKENCIHSSHICNCESLLLFKVRRHI